ncbi:MAG: tRNA lysidine(34) synthetase TilS [Betaproteobacteria bacterium]
MPLVDRVRRTIRQHRLATPDTRVLVALSGGPDSVALAHLLRALDRARELRLVGLVHFNHQLRPAADADERFCAALADALGLPLDVEREDVGARARRERRSIEDAAHVARHAFFERARLRADADVVALGHTRDDQAETVLLRLLRGTGARGRAGMYPRRGALVRPLLDCRRAEVRRWLVDRGIGCVEDESNQNVAIPRNRVRIELLPILERRFNPSIVDVLADEAELARDEWEWMAQEADALVARAAAREGGAWRFDVEALGAAPRALRRLALWRAMAATSGGRRVAFAHVSDALGLLEAPDGTRLDGPGQRLERVGRQLVLRGRPPGAVGRPAGERMNLFEYSLSIPGEVELPEAGCVLSAATSAGPVPPGGPGAQVAIVRGDLCRSPLSVRNRRPGDRFRPAGLGGRKKLQDYFVDRKVSRAERDRVPIVVDGEGRIVWVAGHAIGDEFRVTDPSQGMLILRLKALGGSA